MVHSSDTQLVESLKKKNATSPHSFAEALVLYPFATESSNPLVFDTEPSIARLLGSRSQPFSMKEIPRPC